MCLTEYLYIHPIDYRKQNGDGSPENLHCLFSTNGNLDVIYQFEVNAYFGISANVFTFVVCYYCLAFYFVLRTESLSSRILRFCFLPRFPCLCQVFSSYVSSARLLPMATPAFFLQSLLCLAAARQFFVLSSLAASFHTVSSIYYLVFRLALFHRDSLP